MTTREKKSQQYWHEVLNAGGFTAMPRWTLQPQPGTGSHDVTIPEDLVASLRRVADQLDLSLDSIVFAAHTKVLAALSGETGVVAGYVPNEGGPPLPCRVVTETQSWATLLSSAHRAATELEAHSAYPVIDLRSESGLVEPVFETVFDPVGRSLDLAPDTMLAVDFAQQDGELILKLRHRTEALDGDSAARIAGYHLTALTLIASDPSAEHARQSLISADELHFLVEGLSGPRRELPDQRFHELFEQRVRTHPDTIAAVCGERRWTYQELNARANQLGHALLARGLTREGIVAVVSERNLDWMAAVLAVFKAGGVYLPIEPHFPADRIAAMLSRSECALVLAEPGSTTTLEGALESMAHVQTLSIVDAYREDHDESNPHIEVKANQLAYIYFTSGSTGEPKGAMCEQAGMLNHLYAKIDDLEITEGQVVAQVAPQCFDISLWQLVSALLVGGRTLIIEQEVILDVERFVDTVIDGDVAVLQVVPSYLEVVLSYLDQHPRELPQLHGVSATGEALTKELTERWFAAMPAVKLVNAYGLTETSDDTNHEVMDRPPEGDRVPLGPAVNNVYIYVVDEYLSPVPLGAPGEIVFSGVCVGRGYINDPDRSRMAYMADPIREGERLYRSGDYGRWRPDGKLEFLGRRDAQVKIRGFRIEIGDIESALLRLPGVRNGAVVVAERADGSKQLVAFYSAPQPLEADRMQEQLGEALPAYMVPSAIQWLENLPLTANGKINRKQLRPIAAELDTAEASLEPPTTPTEQRLASAWAAVLGISENQIGRRDDFFDRGGTSLSAVRLAVALDREVSLKDVTSYPVLADLAALVEGRTSRDAGLLQSLSQPAGEPAGVLVCFPYAGGNAVNYQPMATALRSHGLAVYAVELPGHDLAAEAETFVPMSEVVDQVVAEIAEFGSGPVLLWGQSAGAAFAVDTARQLTRAGVNVERVFLGAQLLGDAADRRRAIREVTNQSNAEIAAALSADTGYTDLGELEAQRAEHIGAAFRHDFVSANRYLAEVVDDPPAEKLKTPVTVVVAADDPITEDFANQYVGWQLLAEQVDLHELTDGGHYFPRTRPAESAQAVLRSVRSLSPSLAPKL
jgi:amino acid adenylation domain-containing protein